MRKRTIGLVLTLVGATLAASGASFAGEEQTGDKPAAKPPAGPGPGGGPGGHPPMRQMGHPPGPGMPQGHELPGGPGMFGPGMFGPGGPGAPMPGMPNSEERTKQLKERIEKLKKEGKTEQAEQLERILARPAGSMAPRPPLTPEEIKKRRQTRKFARIRMMNRRYGESLTKPDVLAEVGRHARRTARLARLRTLIQQKPESPERDKLLQRVNQMMGLENTRHNRHMAELAPDSVRKPPAMMAPQPAKSEPAKKSEGEH